MSNQKYSTCDECQYFFYDKIVPAYIYLGKCTRFPPTVWKHHDTDHRGYSSKNEWHYPRVNCNNHACGELKYKTKQQG